MAKAAKSRKVKGEREREAPDREKGSTGDLPSSGSRIPGWLPPAIYALATMILFRKFVFSGEMLFSSDTISLGYMARAFFAEALRDGIFPFWNPIILGGTPFLNSLAGGDSLYPTSLLMLVMEPFRALGWKLVVHVFLSGLFTYGWIRSLGRSRPAALLAGLAYLMAPFMVTLVSPGHDGKLFVSALTPLLFWATESSLVRGRLLSFAGMALVIGLVILTTHFQQAYFLFGAVGIYALVRVILLGKAGAALKAMTTRFGLFLGFSALGAGVAGIQLLPAVEYVLESSRRTATTTQASDEGSVAYSSSWSMHPEELAAMIVPEFAGNNVGSAPWVEGTYWGRNPFKDNHEYVSLVVLLLGGGSASRSWESGGWPSSTPWGLIRPSGGSSMRSFPAFPSSGPPQSLRSSSDSGPSPSWPSGWTGFSGSIPHLPGQGRIPAWSPMGMAVRAPVEGLRRLGPGVPLEAQNGSSSSSFFRPPASFSWGPCWRREAA